MQPSARKDLIGRKVGLIAGMVAFLTPAMAFAAPHAPTPGLAWGLPFAGLLLTIAVAPMLAPNFWHHRIGLVAIAWTAALLIPQVLLMGVAPAAEGAWHALLIEYLPFVTLLLALFTAGGGVLLEGGPWGTPAGNTLLLAIGTALAGVMGTTGVSMVLIHPLLRSNAHRTKRVHLVVFFILLVANAGGATTPLGDPPLYIGFLHGVPFGWPFLNLSIPLLMVAVPLLALFYVIDRRLAAGHPKPGGATPVRVRGLPNLGLIACVVATVLLQGLWQPGDVVLLGQPIGLERLVGVAITLAIAVASVAVTSRSVREGNLFTWHPILEVAKLFAALFITIGPVLNMLAAGFDGPLAALLHVTTDADGRPLALPIFWVTGVLSAFLDNAPTYLVFFQLAGDDAVRLTGEYNNELRAISAGAVFFGGLTYIGNAPNMMVRSIAVARGVRMPGFFGYMVWSVSVLVPLFLLLTALFFR